jgi:6-pyruvoyl-tetrahydropterin synthase
MLRYDRTFRFSAAHFNSRKSYETAWDMLAALELESDTIKFPDVSAILKMLSDIHGHNFKLRVVVDGTLDNEGFVTDDVALEKAAMRYSGVNVSMHPDFTTKLLRATTELMAENIYEAISGVITGGCGLERVELWETDDIFAVAHG